LGHLQGTVPKRRSMAKFLPAALLEEYGTGVAGDLLVHLVSGMNYMLGWNEPPTKVTSIVEFSASMMA